MRNFLLYHLLICALLLALACAPQGASVHTHETSNVDVAMGNTPLFLDIAHPVPASLGMGALLMVDPSGKLWLEFQVCWIENEGLSRPFPAYDGDCQGYGEGQSLTYKLAEYPARVHQ